MPVKRKPDYWIMALAVALLVFGVVMIFSSSAVIAAERFGDPYHYLKRQLMWACLGVAALVVGARVEYVRYMRYAYLLYAGVVVMLALTLIPGVGQAANGARRWISLGFAQFQPAEFAKLALIIFFAAMLTKKRKEGKLSDFQFGYLPNLAALALVFALVQFQPDLGTAMMIALVAVFLFVMAGARFSHVLGTALVVAPLMAVSIMSTSYRKRRIMSFLDPWEDSADAGYQIIQSFVAMANGGPWGVGLGGGQQKLFYLPEPHTDFIYAIIAEELGFAGGMTVLALFAAFVWRGFRVGLKAPDMFGSLLALGITFAVGAQALLNVAVAMGMLPTKGLPLPFISLGGSALVMWMFAVGVLTNVSEHAT